MDALMSSKLGRPARFSRDGILAVAAEIAMADPAGAVSIGAIARHLKVTPMAIYTYFSSKDALLQALSEHLLEGLQFESPPGAAALERVHAWAVRVRQHFLLNPALIHMLSWEGGHNSVAWLNRSDFLIAALNDLGLGEAEFSQAVLWIWAAVLGAVQFEIYDRQANPRLSESEFESLSETVRDGVGKVDRFLRDDAHYERYFVFQMNRLEDGLRAMSPLGTP